MGRDDFYHPYTPYEIQLQLMRLIYATIDQDYKVGLFESPTGTGKTLSLICSTMTWLREYKRQLVYDGITIDDDEPDWVNQQYRDNVVAKQQNLLLEYELYLDNLDVDKLVPSEDVEQPRKRRRVTVEIEEESDLIPKDYQSDEEDDTRDKNVQLSKEIQTLMFQIEGVKESPGAAIHNPTKIYYSSRTHSQLSQFSHQLSPLRFPSSFDNIDERIKYLPLGSRKQYCINDKIKHHLVSRINDECLDLQKSKHESCQYYPTQTTQPMVKLFTDMTFSAVNDIEDIVHIGEQLKVCPYYGVRSGVDVSEIISLPYQILLEPQARQILNLNLLNSVVIIDEAHNLIDVIQLMNSTSVSLKEIAKCYMLLQGYFKKFKRKFNSGNRVNLMKIIKVVGILQKFLTGRTRDGEFTLMEIYDNNTSDLTNFHKLDTYLHKSKILYKLDTYMESTTTSQPLLFKIISFLKSLSNPSNEGKFYYQTRDETMNYILLNPLSVFLELIDKSRCIILAGGTMAPMDEFQQRLFPMVPEEKIYKFTCDHVIPEENLKTFIVKSYRDVEFEFKFANRSNEVMYIKLGEFILDTIPNIPDGVIIFFPSFAILELVITIWCKTGVYEKINQVKEICQELKDDKDGLVLRQYTTLVRSGKGSVLCSVMNGKLSEGINFNDELCRLVIMIGLPYPNEFTTEMKLKRQYLLQQEQGEWKYRAMVENTMARVVNQSCGRCIRHMNDYSVIILVDVRYENVQGKLSKWIRDQLCLATDVGIQCRSFFNNHI